MDCIQLIDSIQSQYKKIPDIKSEAFAIFGNKHKAVVEKSKGLKGNIYYLVSGHGGPDPGAMVVYEKKSTAEDEYVYDITLRLAKELLRHGATVYIIIRDENDGIRVDRFLEIDWDEVAYPKETIPLIQLARLKQWVTIVNDLYKIHKAAYQRLIVTHMDSSSKGQNIDVFFYHHEKSINGKELAEIIHNIFQKKYKKYQPNSAYEGTYDNRTELYLVRNTHPALAYIEIGNIKKKKDQLRILDLDNRQALAKWIGEGCCLILRRNKLKGNMCFVVVIKVGWPST